MIKRLICILFIFLVAQAGAGHSRELAAFDAVGTDLQEGWRELYRAVVIETDSDCCFAGWEYVPAESTPISNANDHLHSIIDSVDDDEICQRGERKFSYFVQHKRINEDGSTARFTFQCPSTSHTYMLLLWPEEPLEKGSWVYNVVLIAHDFHPNSPFETEL